MARVFQATYSGGACPECSDPITKGDDVSYCDNELLHAECNVMSDFDFQDDSTDWDMPQGYWD